MRNRLLLIEGIPGSGKTTLSARLHEYLAKHGVQARLYQEGDSNPVDLGWHARLTMQEYERLCSEHPAMQASIQVNTSFEEDHALIGYLHLTPADEAEALRSFFEAHEVYDGRVSPEVFSSLHRNRWKKFSESEEKNGITLFESLFLQNQLNELMGFQLLDSETIAGHLKALMEPVLDWSPLLIYLRQPDPDETIRRVASQRLSSDKSRFSDWIDHCIQYVEHSPYGLRHGLKGYGGVLRFFKDRRELELEMLQRLEIPYAIVDNPEYDWDCAFTRMTEVLE